jgi:four helix bundle protein
MNRQFKSYRDLEVWQKAMTVAKMVYQATAGFPGEEKFGLVNQMRRAAVSIPSNIAEGHARSSTVEFQRFLSIAMGSVAELETQVILSYELGYLADENQQELLKELDDIGKMLRGLYRSLGNRTDR